MKKKRDLHAIFTRRAYWPWIAANRTMSTYICARVCSYFPIICIVFAQFALLQPLNEQKTHAKEYGEKKWLEAFLWWYSFKKKSSGFHWIHSTYSFQEHRVLFIGIISVTDFTWNYVVWCTQSLCILQARQHIIVFKWLVLSHAKETDAQVNESLIRHEG